METAKNIGFSTRVLSDLALDGLGEAGWLAEGRKQGGPVVWGCLGVLFE